MNLFKHPTVKQSTDHDLEKEAESTKPTDANANATVPADADSKTSPAATNFSSLDDGILHDSDLSPVLFKGKLGEWNEKVEGLAGLEARGITRVLPEDKHGGGPRGHMQMFLLWFSINLVASSIITGFFGPLVFGLGWTDSICIVIFACALGACGPAYTATFGPESGNRTMVSAG
jgi:Permease for cytosine/purines, uracil, thiamine, allantoin